MFIGEAWRRDVPLIVLAVVLLVCLATDVMKGKIYNKITYPTLVFAIGWHLAVNGTPGLIKASVGALVGFLGLFIPFAISRGVGGGDVKLMAAVGALVGFPIIVLAYLYSLLVGGAMAIGILIWKGRFMASMHRIFRFFFTYLLPFLETEELKPEHSEKFKFGWAIAIGTGWAVWEVFRGAVIFPGLI